ncbi:tRNA (cytidine(34)-2'-O)-methyltransferase [Natronospira bacteriovora]|uniref:tRNA (cytidine(34)-2'-O)-methyltransferase n=1 Tax=Natronospira bacteriovora TaxID=3069753 RepID=A0ABU0WA74_9GAMM|nr:tRNA (cytidine(34)-2'-O)-methyltransferase [Natronospira sp. AB-CW4]MDQ2069870.1 tRNA (cytidine(34)-2'-O)-methyltransferase [Natronospira sp. AB-CW4]
MFDIVLYQPEIPPNTGNIMRLAANTGTRLHLIHPLGFDLSEKQLRRAGLDYRDQATVSEHASFEAFINTHRPTRLFALSSKTSGSFFESRFLPGDAFLFGPETRGLPEVILQHPAITARLTLPMKAGNRSLNLGNAVSVCVYEAWRQQGFG